MSQIADTPAEDPLTIAPARSAHEWTDAGVHTFMTEERAADPIDVILDLRSGIGRLPETTSTYTLDRVLDQHDYYNIRPEYFALVGSWRAPDSLVGHNTTTKYVNPLSPNKHDYSDVIVRCECGTAFKKPAHNGRPELPGSYNHAEDCMPYHHYDALGELWRRREQIAKTMLLLGTWTGRDVARRVGLRPEQVQRFSNKLNFSVGDYRETGRDLLAQTAVELLEDHSMAKVACAYNYSKSRLRKVIRDRTDADIVEMREQRKANDTRAEWVPGGEPR